jgi:hypothetical protein
MFTIYHNIQYCNTYQRRYCCWCCCCWWWLHCGGLYLVGVPLIRHPPVLLRTISRSTSPPWPASCMCVDISFENHSGAPLLAPNPQLISPSRSNRLLTPHTTTCVYSPILPCLPFRSASPDRPSRSYLLISCSLVTTGQPPNAAERSRTEEVAADSGETTGVKIQKLAPAQGRHPSPPLCSLRLLHCARPVSSTVRPVPLTYSPVTARCH